MWKGHKEEVIGQGDKATLMQMHNGSETLVCFYMLLSQLDSSAKYRKEPYATLFYLFLADLCSLPLGICSVHVA